MQNFRAKVVENIKLTWRMIYVDFELISPHRLEFQAGQYLMLRVPGEAQLRHYSIVNPPSMDHGAEILVDVTPGGVATKYLQNLKPGEEVEFMAPGGQFVITDPTSPTASIGAREKGFIFVASGSGISPIRSMILDLLVDKKDKRPIWLHWGLRNKADIFWFEEFAELAETYKNFTFDLTLSDPPEGWELCQGRVEECLFKEHHQSDDLADTGFYLCGNRVMIDQVKAELVKRGISLDRIHHEKFY